MPIRRGKRKSTYQITCPSRHKVSRRSTRELSLSRSLHGEVDYGPQEPRPRWRHASTKAMARRKIAVVSEGFRTIALKARMQNYHHQRSAELYGACVALLQRIDDLRWMDTAGAAPKIPPVDPKGLTILSEVCERVSCELEWYLGVDSPILPSSAIATGKSDTPDAR